MNVEANNQHTIFTWQILPSDISLIVGSSNAETMLFFAKLQPNCVIWPKDLNFKIFSLKEYNTMKDATLHI